jgi:hypothetical protein
LCIQIELSRVVLGPNNPNPLEVARHIKQLREECKMQFEIGCFNRALVTIH